MTPAPVFPALPKTGRKFAASISEPVAVAQPPLLFALQLLLHFGKVERAHRLLDRRETFQKDLGILGEEAHRHVRGTPNCLPHRQVPTFIALPFRSDLI